MGLLHPPCLHQRGLFGTLVTLWRLRALICARQTPREIAASHEASLSHWNAPRCTVPMHTDAGGILVVWFHEAGHECVGKRYATTDCLADPARAQRRSLKRSCDGFDRCRALFLCVRHGNVDAQKGVT
jgi:hypothetical protein